MRSASAPITCHAYVPISSFFDGVLNWLPPRLYSIVPTGDVVVVNRRSYKYASLSVLLPSSNRENAALLSSVPYVLTSDSSNSVNVPAAMSAIVLAFSLVL